jgi:predicted ATPase
MTEHKLAKQDILYALSKGRRMKRVICLYGGPGTGKSTTAAHLFALLKQSGVNAELVCEYVKEWAWEGRKILDGDQYYFLAKQSRRERIRFRRVDVMVTDSPVWLSAVYEQEFEQEPFICQMMIDKHVQGARRHNVKHEHVFLRRLKQYNPNGRFQTEDEARRLDEKIKTYLDDHGIEYIEVCADADAANNIVKFLGLL